MSSELDSLGAHAAEMSPGAQHRAMGLLRAIYAKTGGRGRAVRDVAELETGLTAEEARGAWRDLIRVGLIERFSLDYAARLSVTGLDFIQNAPPAPSPSISTPQPAPSNASRKILIAYGRDTLVREALVGFAEEMHVGTVALHDRVSNGRSIMEQVEAHGHLDFVFVLLSPDDLGYIPGASELRPRLEVLLDLGYFMGRFGRGRVCAFSTSNEFQPPSDLAGVSLRLLDADGAWKSALSRELELAGFEPNRQQRP
jgi:hypothetical protein